MLYNLIIVGIRVQVNGQSLLGSSHQEAVRALRSVGDKMVILVCDQLPEKSEANSPGELSSPSSQGGFLSSLHGSVSSIDKEDEESRIIQQVGHRCRLLMEGLFLRVSPCPEPACHRQFF